MTKNVINLLLIIVAPVFFSCEKRLELSPISNYNASSFYKTPEDFEIAINGAYNRLQGLYNGTMELALESRSDNTMDDIKNNYSHNKIHRFVDDASNSVTADIMRGFWSVIDRSNAILDRIDNIDFVDAQRKSNLKGEAYFLRGYSYFQLAWLFGGVPLIDRQLTVDQIKEKPRSTQEESFSFAAADLAQAAQLLPASWESKDLGKATAFAAKGILARMYLFQEKYSEAKVLLSDIINSGNYAMASQYQDIFSDGSDNSKEHVFQIQFKSGNLGQGNGFVAMQVPHNFTFYPFTSGGISGAMLVSPGLYDLYEDGDVRRDYSIYTIDAGTMYYFKYAHTSNPPADRRDFEINIPILRYTDVKLMYAEILNEESYSSSGQAFDILNEIRTRAGASSLTSAEVPNQDAFRIAILDERRREFACEFLRWFDLIRTGNAVPVMNAFLQKPEEGGGTYSMQATQVLFPIPDYEIKVYNNPAVMPQNPGY